MSLPTGWQVGDVVSLLAPPHQVIGKVIALRRHSDGVEFFMVECIGGAGRIGARFYPDHWLLGTGRFQQYCRDCGQEYRTEDVAEVLCPACRREIVLTRPTESTEEPAHVRLYGRGRRHIG